MLLRRVFIAIVSTALLAATVLSGTASAATSFSADGITLSNIRTNPAALSGSGQVSVTVNIAVDTSRADGGLSNAHVEGTGVSSDTIDNISIGDSSDLHFTLAVAASQLGAPISLTLKWDGAASGLPFTVTVGSSAPTEPQINFTRTIDKSAAAKGDSITLVYNIENAGAIDITSLTVTDEGIPDMSLTKSSLKAGSTAALTYTYTVNSDFTSTPKLTYSAGGKNYSATCAVKTVTLKVLQMDAVLEASPETANAGDEVTLLCTLTNTGNVKLTNLSIGEKTLGNNIFTAPALDVGASKQFSRKVALTQTTSFQYTITAKDDTGNAVSFSSNELQVTISSASGQYDLEIQASPDALQLSQPGTVNFNITVTNKGTDAVANASVVDQDGNVIKTFDSLLPGSITFPYPKDIDKTTQFNFCLFVPGASGGTDGNYQVYTGPIEINVAEATATPALTDQATVAPTPSDASQTTSGSASPSKMGVLLTALLVVGFLIVVTAVVLVAMIVSDRRKRGRKR